MSNLTKFAQEVGKDVKQITINIGAISGLSTDAKDNHVAAINELVAKLANVGSGTGIQFVEIDYDPMFQEGYFVTQDINPTDYGTLSGQAESYKKFKLLVNSNDGVTETDIQQGNKNIYPLKPEYQMNINVQPKANFGYTLPTMYGRAVDFTAAPYELIINLTS